MTETVFHTPFETCKVRMQAREFAHCKSSWECAQEMLRAEGALSLYRGFEVRPAKYLCGLDAFRSLITLHVLTNAHTLAL